MINALIEQNMEDMNVSCEPRWIRLAYLAIVSATLFALMIATATACPSGEAEVGHSQEHTMIATATPEPATPVPVDITSTCPSCVQVRKHVQKTLPGTTIGEIRKSPAMKGIYEIQMGKTIAYTNKEGRLFIVGHMYDPAHSRDLTAARLADLNRVQWKDLPLKDAIVSGPKDGLKLAIFTDPECPFCRRLETMLKGMKGLRIYTFLFPLESIHPQALAMSQSIWCAKDQQKAMLSIMLDGKTLPAGTCDTTVINRNIQLGRRLGINGTPGLISRAGLTQAGAPQSPHALRTWLARK